MNKIYSGWFSGCSDSEIISVGGLDYFESLAWYKLRRAFPTFKKVLTASESELLRAGLSSLLVQTFKNRPTNTNAAERLMASKNIRLLTVEDKEYPSLLKEIADPPLWLYLRGDQKAFKTKTLTVVGTRKPTAYAMSVTEKLLSPTLLKKVTVVSGLAYGIDKTAHQLSVKHGGRTIAVLAGGLDAIYPADHYRLADEIINTGGLLVSEYPPLTRPKPYRFPVRNRILAGLSPLTIVIEANLKSGTLTTAKSALDYNRDLMAVPGDITRQLAEGPNFLIKRGAGLLDKPEELNRYYGLSTKTKSADIDNHLSKILDLLAEQPYSVDRIVTLTGRTIDTVLAELTQLELLGLVYQTEGGDYSRKKK